MRRLLLASIYMALAAGVPAADFRVTSDGTLAVAAADDEPWERELAGLRVAALSVVDGEVSGWLDGASADAWIELREGAKVLARRDLRSDGRAQTLALRARSEGGGELKLVARGKGLGNSWWKGAGIRKTISGGTAQALMSGGASLELEPGGSFRVRAPQGPSFEFPAPRVAPLAITRVAGVLRAEGKAPDGGPMGWTFAPAGEGAFLATLAGRGAMDRGVEFPESVRAAAGDWWVLPLNEGIRVKAEDPGFKYDWDPPLSAGHFVSMPFVALEREGWTLLMICEERADANLRMRVQRAGEAASFSFTHQPTLGTWGYARRVRLELVKGNYVDAMKAYRRWAEGQGLVRTLKQKAAANPRVEKLYGAVNLWRWANGPAWKADPEPEKFAAELKALGVTRVLWSHELPSLKSAGAVAALGYLTGRYRIVQDLYDPDYPMPWVDKRGWKDERVMRRDGEWKRGWVHKENGKDYPAAVRCSLPGLKRFQQSLREDASKIPYQACFLDTTTASPAYECWDPAHRIDGRGDLAAKRKILAQIAAQRQVTGSESGADWALSEVDYFEGMLSIAMARVPDSGYDLFKAVDPGEAFGRYQVSPRWRVPLWELAYHDCAVSYYYWGDASNRIPEYWDQRDLLCLLYGQPPFWHVDPKLWAQHQERYLKSYFDVTPFANKVAGRRMLSHRILDADAMVQESVFEGGAKVTVNFSGKDYGEGAGLVKARGFRVEGPR